MAGQVQENLSICTFLVLSVWAADTPTFGTQSSNTSALVTGSFSCRFYLHLVEEEPAYSSY